MKLIYEPVFYELDNEKELVSLLDKEDAFIASTIQYKPLLDKLKSGAKGIVLGCDAHAADGYEGRRIVFLGDGLFHALMIKKSFPDKEVVVLNPFTMKRREVGYEDVKGFVFREKLFAEKLKEARDVGIIVSIKFGQNRMAKALDAKKRLESEGKKVYLFLFDTVNPDEFVNFGGIDVLINSACPRIGFDDYGKFPVPIGNIELLDEALGKGKQQG